MFVNGAVQPCFCYSNDIKIVRQDIIKQGDGLVLDKSEIYTTDPKKPLVLCYDKHIVSFEDCLFDGKSLFHYVCGTSRIRFIDWLSFVSCETLIAHKSANTYFQCGPFYWVVGHTSSPTLTGEQYGKNEPKYPEGGHWQNVLHHHRPLF